MSDDRGEAVLIITSSYEGAVDPVVNEFKSREELYYRLNVDELPGAGGLSICLAEEFGGELVSASGRPLELGNIKSCWYRHPRLGSKGPERMPEGYWELAKNEYKAALWSLYTNMDAFWMNHPLVGVKLLEANKALQLRAARHFGLSVPETIISDQPDAIIEFCGRHGGVVAVKLISGHVFRTTDNKEDTLLAYTQRLSLSDLQDRREDLEVCPVFVQEYVEKEYELRITVVGSEVYACRIDSQASERTLHDWRRYDFENVEHRKTELPATITEKIIALVNNLGLNYAAIDMIRRPDGEYVFLELNPSGQWGWIEELTGLPITEAIADYLVTPPTKSERINWNLVENAVMGVSV